jgi:NADPH:quinone reductase-like Zn-dependent oxidoreductase
MKAYLVSKYKRPMQVGEVAEPAIDDHEVLVEVHAAGVNLLDAKIRDESSSGSSPTRRHSSSGTTSPASSPASGRP